MNRIKRGQIPVAYNFFVQYLLKRLNPEEIALDNDTLDTALRELTEERERLSAVRLDYSATIRSRFHGLRMLWFSLKHVLGILSPRDRYATWSEQIELSTTWPTDAEKTGIFPAPTSDSELATNTAEAQLIHSWAQRNSAQPLSVDPIVSVVIPAYNHAKVTVRCLQSIVDTWCETMQVQIILVDDASSDRTEQIARQLPGLIHLRNALNQGFLRSCNRGVQAANGKYICFLNNDTTVSNGWLDRLVSRAESDETIGVVGAKLVYPDGTLQEAGGIIWSDGSGWNYGRNGDPQDARYNYVRDVDYCSGAALLVRAGLLRSLGGFDSTFTPAYYEDVDLCFAARSLGYRVVYEPRSEVTHYEGVSSGTDMATGVKRFQQVNRPKFCAKWGAELADHSPPDACNVPFAARRLRKRRVALVVDDYVPLHDKEAGSLRLLRIVEILLELDYHVFFLPDNYAALQPYTYELQAVGVEVLHHTEEGRTLDTALDEILPMVNVAWISRPKLFEKYAPRIRQKSDAKLIFDTVDLHFVRMQREAALFDKDPSIWKSSERDEIAAAKSADATVAVTPDEREILLASGVRNVSVIPTIHEIQASEPRIFEASSGVLFIGGFNHPPNRDAARWLCLEVMPMAWKHIPDAKVTLLGSSPSADVLDLASERVSVPGYVFDVGPYFMHNRVFAAALRFGAGHKGKVGQSLSFGLPLVTTAVGAEGFHLTDEVNCLLADRTEEFADAIVRLYTDGPLWEKISRNSIVAIRPFTVGAILPNVAQLFEQVYATGNAAQASGAGR